MGAENIPIMRFSSALSQHEIPRTPHNPTRSLQGRNSRIAPHRRRRYGDLLSSLIFRMRARKPSLTTSLLGWLQAATRRHAEQAVEPDLETLRSAMSRLLDDPLPPAQTALLTRIAVAPDAQTLWFLRSELMSVLAHAHGERHARLALDGLDLVFQSRREGFRPSQPPRRPL